MSDLSEMQPQPTALDIAIVGMAGRFPQANDLDAFWRNLCDGLEAISLFSDEELAASGVDPAEFTAPNYVRAAPVLHDIELFDADFFGYSPLEAKAMDPQQRFLLECVWQALEHAGYDPHTYPEPIGVFAGARMSSYIVNLYSDALFSQPPNQLLVLLGNDISSLSTRISYKLNLRGPSCAVQSGCSTALVTVHLACQSLLFGECRLALAGAVTINVPHQVGYLYEEASMLSPDGHCHTFDAKAQGTVFGSGMGVVVLKRLEDAIADGDSIYAVIKGSATNNDGAFKASFTAPSVEGQRAVVIDALASSGIEAETISYIEAHATATALGDPIEVRALTQAFRASTSATQFCRIGSVKSNLGHLDAAAGMAGLLKTTLALQHKQLPPTLYFEQSNPEIDFASSPFYVNTELVEWESEGLPRRAGVSSFGFGGTNAHVILEEAPELAPTGPSRPWQLLLLSARSEAALEQATSNLVSQMREQPELKLADVAYTLQVGRHAFGRRRMLLCRDVAEAAEALEAREPSSVFSNEQERGERPLAFLLPGQGAQYVDMARELYQSEPVFRAELDRCAELLVPHLGLDMRELLYPTGDWRLETGDRGAARHDQPPASSLPPAALEQTQYTQPALFVVEYALAQLWSSWGVVPDALLGHSIGEYVAACLAGVFSLEDALALVAARGRLMQSLPMGAMLSVSLSEAELLPYLHEHPQLDLAACNAPSLSVVAGPAVAIDALERQLNEQGHSCRRLHTSHAFHSKLMQPIVDAFGAEVERVRLQPPSLRFISNLSGTWITDEQATDPQYWAQQLRRPVRFAEGLQTLCAESEHILLEVGPGRTLSTFARQSFEGEAAPIVLQSLRHPQDALSDVAFLLSNLGKLWLAGRSIDWNAFSAHERRRRVPLPSYPFERQRYWVEAKGSAPGQQPATLARKADLGEWLYLPAWKSSLRPEPLAPGALAERPRNWLVFVDEHGLGERLVQRLRSERQNVVTVHAGAQFGRLDEASYRLNPQRAQDYSALLSELRSAEALPSSIVHLWTLTPDEQTPSDEGLFERQQALGLYSLLYLAQALGAEELESPLALEVISNQLHAVTGSERLCPEKATILGPCRVIPREYLQISCRSIDLVVERIEDGEAERLVEQLLAELCAEPVNALLAYRDGRRWSQGVEPIRLAAAREGAPRLREQGVYLITGGLGGIGLVLAAELARKVRAKLLLLGRRAFPTRAQWGEWLMSHEEGEATSRIIRQLQELEELGSEVELLQGDVTNAAQMQAVIAQGLARFGALHGVIHAAGVAGGGLIQLKTPEMVERVLAPKTRGVLALEAACRELPLDFMLLCSSLTSIVGEFGQADYAAANAFLDAFAHWQAARQGPFTVTVNWDTWQTVGMAINTEVPPELKMVHDQIMQGGLMPAEGVEIFERVLAQSTAPQVLVSTKDLPLRIESVHALTRAMLEQTQEQTRALANRSGHARPSLATAYVAPRNEFEQNVATVWQQVLGLEQVGIHDSFFDLGGHSLLITQLLNKLHRIYQAEIAIQSLFDNPTVAGMAQVIEQAYLLKAGSNEKPIKELVRGVTAAERQSLLEAYWKKKMATALQVALEQLPASGSLEEYNLEAVIADVQWNFQQDLGLQVFPYEVSKLRSIGDLARFTAAELDRLTNLKQNSYTAPTSLYEQYEARSQLEQRVKRPLLIKPTRKNAPIVFVQSSPRSGSTLFRVMLAGHPGLFSPPELGILWYDTLRDWQRSLVDPDYGHGFYWAGQGMQVTFMELLGRDRDSTNAYLDELAEQELPIHEIYTRLQQLIAPRLLVDKSPTYGLSLETLQRAEELFDRPKYIHLVRHPYSVIESFVRIRIDKLFSPVIYGSDDVDPFVVGEKVWYTCNRNMLTLLRNIEPERQLRVYYEELVSRPEEVMRGVCNFVDLPYDPAVIQPYDDRRERMIAGNGDPNLLTHQGVDARLSETWRRVKLPWRLGEPAQRVAAELGYELPAESEAPAEPPVEPSILDLADASTIASLIDRAKQLSPEEVQALLEGMDKTS